MNFSATFQLKNKKFWWVDIIFYFAVSLLVATAFCYFIFLIKNYFLVQDIVTQDSALLTVGTDQQKDHEEQVVYYQIKINDFTNLLENHQFASNVFAFMQAQTMPNTWFKQFSLDQKNASVQLSGESEDLSSLSRQVAVFEGNKYVKNVGALNTLLGQAARTEFNINLVLDKSIFNYLSDKTLLSETKAESEEPLTQENQ